MTLAELKQKRPVTITVQQAAKILGVTPRYIQAVLQQDTTAERPLYPFGTAVKFTRWSYRIYTDRLIAWLEAQDISRREA